MDDENESQTSHENAKRVKVENLMEIKIIIRIRAVSLHCEFNVNVGDCIFSQVPALRGNDIRYLCFICGPSTSGCSRARDLMRHSLSNHDLFPSGVEQGEHYFCDARDLTKPTVEQYEKYKDGSHRGKKKLEENERTEAGRKWVEVRTKAGKKAKKEKVASTSREVDLAELMRKREEQVAIQNAGKIEARKREDTMEPERVTAEKKKWMEEERKNRE